MIASYVHGSDERSRMIRRTLARYLLLVQALTFQAVSTAVKRRFPTLQHLVAAGIMTKEELSLYEKVTFPYGKWWLPCHWFTALATRARKEGRIKDSILLDGLFRELFIFRTSCSIMIGYDWISVPLVYTQVVTLATYMYSVALMVGRQYLDPTKGYPKNHVDLYVPLFTLLQFFFYVGWLKVAEQIVNPYGEDDDDFELNWCLDRAVHIAYLIVDNMQMKHPKVKKDFFWDEPEPRLPQTKHSMKYILNPQLGSAFSLNVEEAEYLPMDILLEEDDEGNIYKGGSMKHCGTDGFRSSFISRVMNSRFGQSLRRSSARKGIARSTSQQPHGLDNPAFSTTLERTGPSARSSPSMSRKSSLKTLVRKISPSHSRSSSASFRPNSLNLHRYKTYELQEAEKMNLPNGRVTENVKPAAYTNLPATRTVSAPVVSITQEGISSYDVKEGKESSLASDIGLQKLDIAMPSIPEENSRAPSIGSIETGLIGLREKQFQQDNEVQDFVREASKVLKELNKTVYPQQHECQSKGYESCCSANSNISSAEESSDDTSSTFTENEQAKVSITIEMNESKNDQEDIQKINSELLSKGKTDTGDEH
ncbi:Bestrophin-3, partial [Stegodyphus mimosarum]